MTDVIITTLREKGIIYRKMAKNAKRVYGIEAQGRNGVYNVGMKDAEAEAIDIEMSRRYLPKKSLSKSTKLNIRRGKLNFI